MLRPGGSLRLDASRKVSHHHTAVGRVAMLTTRTGVTSSLDANVTIEKLELLLGDHLDRRHRDRAGVYTSLPLGWRNALPAVTASFLKQEFYEKSFTAHLEIDSAFVESDLGLETVILSVANVDLCLLLAEQLCVHATLSGANFDCSFHDGSFVNRKDGGSNEGMP